MSPHIPVQIWSCYSVAVCECIGSQLVCSQYCSGDLCTSFAVGSPAGMSVTNDSSSVAHFIQLSALVFFRVYCLLRHPGLTGVKYPPSCVDVGVCMIVHGLAC